MAGPKGYKIKFCKGHCALNAVGCDVGESCRSCKFKRGSNLVPTHCSKMTGDRTDKSGAVSCCGWCPEYKEKG